MNPTIAIAALVIVVVLIIIAAALIARRRKTNQLRRTFGPEYDRTLRQERGNARRTESELADREKRVEQFPLRALSVVDREGYAMEWATVQRHFVDDPNAAVGTADRLVSRVMLDRGYPMADFDQRAADISVSYPAVVQNYRAAHDIVTRHGDGGVSTEELRQAMVHYRSLFDELLAPPADAAKPESPKVERIDSRRGVTRERAS